MGKWDKVLARLEAYKPKALGAVFYQNGETQCAVSAVLPSAAKLGTSCLSIDALLKAPLSYRLELKDTLLAVDNEAAELGLSPGDLYEMQRENDAFLGHTKESRYASMLDWVAMKAKWEQIDE